MTELTKLLLNQTNKMSWQDKLSFISSKPNVVFSTSFSIEDQIITDFIASNNLPIKIFTLDTGRLPKETYKVWQETVNKYQIKIQAFYPDEKEISEFVSNNGINPFYESKEMRLSCCQIRKVQPLKLALKNQEIWISGIRKGQSSLRNEKEFFEFDNNLQIAKFYPLLDESEEYLWQEIKQKNIPYNLLYDEGYKSIGCEPCTRAVKAGEDDRSGRWWWEEDESKECGLHLVNGKLIRKNNANK